MKKSFIESRQFVILLHILIWSTIVLLQILSFQSFISHRPEWMEPIKPMRLYYGIIYNTTMMVLIYYLNSLVFIPKVLFRKKIVQFIIIIVAVVLIGGLLKSLFDIYFDPIVKVRFRPPDAGFKDMPFGKEEPLKRFPFDFKRAPVWLIPNLLVVAVSTSLKLAQKWFENESKQKAMVHEKVNSELSLLKSQVNPHFLFNTLNGIYSLANTKSDKTAPAIVMLSRMMRYMLDESKQEYVPLSSELDYINTFIELQKLRLFENVKVNFEIIGESEGIKIQPLLLIPFIENAFKHGTDSSTDCSININLDIKKESIQLKVENDILKIKKEDTKSGFGLNNIKRRLELEYPNKYILTTKSDGGKFIVTLIISIE